MGPSRALSFSPCTSVYPVASRSRSLPYGSEPRVALTSLLRSGATGRGNKIEPSKRMQCVEGQSAWRLAPAAQEAYRIKKKHVGMEHPIGIMWKIPFRMGGPWMQRHCAQADGLSLPFSDSLSLSLAISASWGRGRPTESTPPRETPDSCPSSTATLPSPW